jgi:hypothetical protein
MDINREIRLRSFPETFPEPAGERLNFGKGEVYENSSKDPDPVARIRYPGMDTGNAATTETCAFGDPNGIAASQCRGFVDGNTDGKCDKAAEGILGIAAAALPAWVGDTVGLAQEAPLPLAVASRAIWISGYFAVHGMNHKKR